MNLPATTTAESASQRPWDVVVIGAGPAGALAAREVAVGGARTLLIDRRSFPRRKVCGACVSGHGLSVLRSVGLSELVERLGGLELRRFQVHADGRGVRLPLPGGMAVSRQRLDLLLAEAAVNAGADFLPETTATVPADGVHDGWRLVQISRVGQVVTELQAKLVLVAGGLGCSALDRAEFQSDVAPGSRVGAGVRIEHFPGTYAPGSIYMAVGRGGYAGLVRVEDGSLNVAAALDREFVRQAGGPAEAVAALLDKAGLRRIPALDSADWQGTVPLTRRTRPLAAHRLFVLGDAAGYVEPFTGEGIAWALSAARQVAPLAAAAVERWEPGMVSLWPSMYRRLIRRRQRWCRWLAASLRSPLLAGALLKAVSLSPAIARPFITRVNGPAAAGSFR